MTAAAPSPPTRPVGRGAAAPAAPPATAPAGTRAPTADEQAGLRRVVGALAGSRRPLPAACRVGRPGGTSHDFVVVSTAALDQALRVDVVAALLARARTLQAAPALWLSRSGSLGVEDADLAWYAAARAAYGEAGVSLLMVVATRHGWYAPATGQRQAWRRLRLDR